MQVGGPLGAYLPEAQFDVPLDYEAYAAIGAMVGHGGLVADAQDHLGIVLVEVAADLVGQDDDAVQVPHEDHGRGDEVAESLTVLRLRQVGQVKA